MFLYFSGGCVIRRYLSSDGIEKKSSQLFYANRMPKTVNVNVITWWGKTAGYNNQLL